MTLSVVIVNYNVKYFLEQCLISVYNSMKGIEGEVFVVDNASADGSCQMVRQRFSNVKLIENKQNFGFSYANNQAMRIAQGEFVLLLNPDTVVEENTFAKCISFMQKNQHVGSLSVKMIDGKGNYLPESKRALPSPMVSFYKIFGFSKLFPRSKTFARYHLGHLDENSTHEIEILPGAFMFMRKSALDKVGLLDEEFFMYGEDIDLSYRILKGGYKNYYLPETTIIHYKGESTKKGSINYVLVFYKAMMIFARKHFSKKNASLYVFLIYIAIYFRAAISLSKRLVDKMLQPFVDASIMAIGLTVIIPLWQNYRFDGREVYSSIFITIISASYILVWLISSWFSGAYDKPQKLFAASKGIAVGTLVILAIYALLPNDLRFSRAIIILTAIWSVILVQLAHLLIGMYRKDIFPALKKRKRIAIVGLPEETKRVLSILEQASVGSDFIGKISPTTKINHSEEMASIDQLTEFVRVNGIDEVIFCSANISSQEIIKTMLTLVPFGVDYKIAPPDSISVIGSNSIDTSGDLYTIDFSAISEPANRRNKRVFDFSTAVAVIILAPFLSPFVKNFGFKFVKAFGVLVGKFAWVGYFGGTETTTLGLPQIKKGVFPPVKSRSNIQSDNDFMERMNILYAKNYKVSVDFTVLWSHFFS
jgi:O-antigen biosynthesis protein